MRKLLGFCVLVVLISSSNGYGQSTNKAAEENLTKGDKAYENNDFKSAVTYYTKAIELDPKYAAAFRGRGDCYGELKKYPESISEYNKAIELDPKYITAYNGRGLSYNDLKKHSEAIADFTKAIELDPKNTKA